METLEEAGDANERRGLPGAGIRRRVAGRVAPGMPAVRRVASVTERLRERDFAQLSPDELARLATLMRELVISVPPRR